MSGNDLKTVLLCSVLLAISFPPFPLGFLAPLALAIFLNYIIQRPPQKAFLSGYFLGVFWGAMTLFWIATNTLPGAVLTVLINSLHYGILWWVFRRMHHRNTTLAWFALPFLWVALEYLRHFTDIRFNWLTIAYTQTYYLPFFQFIEWTGYLGLSFLLIVISILLHRLIFQKKAIYRTAVILFLLVMLPVAYGKVRLHQLEAKPYPSIRVGMVQPNVDPFQKWEPDFQDSAFVILEESTLAMSSARPQLVVWPETATPFYLGYRSEYLQRVFQLVDSLQIYLITGTPDYRYFPDRDDYETYNAAFFFAPGRFGYQWYYKMALVPAAESMPFKKYLPFLRRIDVGGGDFFPGHEFKVFQMDILSRTGRYVAGKFTVKEDEPEQRLRVGVSSIICFESVFPHLVRKFVQNGARLLTIITNDGWFGVTSGPFQHAQYAIYRAVENRVSIARCANTGISFFIDHRGVTSQRAGLLKKAVLTENLPVSNIETFYTKHGDWPGVVALVFTLVIIVVVWFPGKQKQE